MFKRLCRDSRERCDPQSRRYSMTSFVDLDNHGWCDPTGTWITRRGSASMSTYNTRAIVALGSLNAFARKMTYTSTSVTCDDNEILLKPTKKKALTMFSGLQSCKICYKNRYRQNFRDTIARCGQLYHICNTQCQNYHHSHHYYSHRPLSNCWYCRGSRETARKWEKGRTAEKDRRTIWPSWPHL